MTLILLQELETRGAFHIFPKKINVINLLSQYKFFKRRHPPGVVVVGFVGSIKWINHVIVYPALVSRNITVTRIYGTVWCKQIIYQISYLILQCWAYTSFNCSTKIQSWKCKQVCKQKIRTKKDKKRDLVSHFTI